MRLALKILYLIIFINFSVFVFFCSYANETFRHKFQQKFYGESFDVGNLVKIGEKFMEKKKLAVVIPFRNTFHELWQFAPHMKMFLTNKSIPFHIFVINQTDNLRFNRGALINVGFLYTRSVFDYCVHHDVDLLPLNTNLSYEYPGEAVFHVADEFYHPTVKGISPYIGGILVVPNEIFEKVDGLRHDFWGWGGEDEELFYALRRQKIPIHQPPHNFSTDRSNTFLHIHDSSIRPRDDARCNGQKLDTSRNRVGDCGLNGTKYSITEVKEFQVDDVGFTVVSVSLICDPNITPWCKC